jgi:hypothetical protein
VTVDRDPARGSGGLRRLRGKVSTVVGGSARVTALVAAALSCALTASDLVSSPEARALAASRRNVSNVSGPCKGSSNPTFLSNNRRLAAAGRGRLLAVYDPHGKGQQLAWRNRRGRWRTRTRGDVRNGFFTSSRTGDRPASIAVARDSRGKRHAWIVWAGADFRAGRLALELRRLSDLKDRRGPLVGPPVGLTQPGSGHVRPDLAFENAPSGNRAAIVWLDRTGPSSFDLSVGWIIHLGRQRPRLVGRSSLLTSRRGTPSATLVPTSDGMRVVAINGKGKLRLFRHSINAPLTSWTRVGRALKVSRKGKPTAVRYKRKLVIAAAPGRRKGSLAVVRFRRTGRPKVILRLRGYTQPSLSRVGRKIVLVMVRKRDGRVVSRTLRRRWSRKDRVEIGRTRGRRLAWPSTMREARGRLSFIVQGPRCRSSRNRNGVLAVSRRV